jgi:hypothetical protein
MLRARRSVVTAAIVLALALTLWLLHWHGLDYPAQLYRVGLVRRQGLGVWDANWYGGHYTPAYGVIVPWLASMVGLAAIAIASTLASVVVFERLLVETNAPHVVTGTAAFGFLMLVNMYEGRLPFATGVLFGLLTVALARREHWWLVAFTTVLTTLASPVAGAFLALAFTAWALSLPTASWRELLWLRQTRVAFASLAITAGISLIFHEGGYFPYNIADMLIAVGAGAMVWWVLMPDNHQPVRWGFALAALVAVPLLILPNPMGGNLSRLAVIGAPILCAMPRRKLAAHAAVCLVLLCQQAEPLLRLPQAVEDPSANAAYFKPLIDELHARHDGPVRLEIPMTVSHWEAAYVARDIPLARGWERQLDLRYNAVLYDPDMTADQYQQWLDTNSVTYVAVPDAPLEEEAQHEVTVIHEAPYLREVWSNEHWQLYSVIGAPSLVSGPASLVKMTAGLVKLDVSGLQPIEIKMRYTPHFSVVHGRGCLSESSSGLTTLEPLTTGRITLRTSLFPNKPEYCEP